MYIYDYKTKKIEEIIKGSKVEDKVLEVLNLVLLELKTLNEELYEKMQARSAAFQMPFEQKKGIGGEQIVFKRSEKSRELRYEKLVDCSGAVFRIL